MAGGAAASWPPVGKFIYHATECGNREPFEHSPVKKVSISFACTHENFRPLGSSESGLVRGGNLACPKKPGPGVSHNVANRELLERYNNALWIHLDPAPLPLTLESRPDPGVDQISRGKTLSERIHEKARTERGRE